MVRVAAARPGEADSLPLESFSGEELLHFNGSKNGTSLDENSENV